MAIVKASPQMGARSDEGWAKYAAKWGVAGEFAKAEVDSSLLATWAESGILGTSRQLDETTISDKQAGKSPIGPTIITRTPNERAQTFVIDGTHSLAARVRSYQKAAADAKDFSKTLEERRAAKKIRDANAKTEVIISKAAAEYLNLELPGEKAAGGLWLKFNPHHDAKGRFTSAPGSKSRTFSGGIRGEYEPQAGDVLEIPAHGNRYGFTVKVHKVDGDVAHVGYADSDKFTVEMPKGSVKHFANDLSGIVDGPPESGNAHIDAVISGEAKFLGKGNDGVVFEHDGKIIKASTTVPFQPFNRGHLSSMEAKDRLKEQFETAKEMHKAGVPGIMKQSLREHGEKAFVIRDKLEIPDKFTDEQIAEIRSMVQAAHDKGYTFNDWIQVGVGKDGKLYHFDTGNAKKSDSKHDRQSDMWEIDAIVSNDMQARKSLATETITKAFNPNQPRVPAGSPAGGQFSSNHAAAKGRILSKISAALDKGDPVFGEPIPAANREAYSQAMAATLDGMNEAAISALDKNLEDVDFYPNSLWMTHRIAGAKSAQESSTGILGAWEFNEQTGAGKLHLDGGIGDKTTRLSTDSIRHVYAHEVSHAIDWIPDSAGGGQTISSTAKWVDAYSTELKSGMLSSYATVSASEGFAEFGRLVNHSPAIARERFPKCAAVWAKHGLID